ncbi:MAG: hypothetical protein COB50_03000 [Thiotrichales bacterium]|nr:MAG: hypothetical protein COB50_03000 [Thiotrichales bacterium]
MELNTHNKIKGRNSFYKKNYRRIIYVLFAAVFSNIVLSFVFIYFVAQPPKYVFYASSHSARLTPLQPRPIPVISSKALITWASENIPGILSLDFINYKKQLYVSKRLFSEYGWNQFMGAFRAELSNIVSGQLVAHAAITNTPVITRQGIVEGIYTWQLQVPMLVTFQHGSSQRIMHVVWTVILQRKANSISKELVHITQVVQNVIRQQ